MDKQLETFNKEHHTYHKKAYKVLDVLVAEYYQQSPEVEEVTIELTLLDFILWSADQAQKPNHEHDIGDEPPKGGDVCPQ